MAYISRSRCLSVEHGLRIRWRSPAGPDGFSAATIVFELLEPGHGTTRRADE